MSAKITLVKGLGLGDQSHLLSELLLQDIQAKSVDFDSPFESSFKTQIESSNLVVMRSRWSSTVEENIFVKSLARKHHSYFESLHESLKAEKIKVVALGRAALIWLEWFKVQKFMSASPTWSKANMASGSWIDTKISTKNSSTISIRGLLTGRAFMDSVNFGKLSVKPWVEFNEKPVGWIIGERLYISTIDLLALSERAQLSDYGYEDLSMISTRSNLIQMLLNGEV